MLSADGVVWPIALGAAASVAVFQSMGWILWEVFCCGAIGGGAVPHTRYSLLLLFFQQVLGIGCAMVALLFLAIFGYLQAWTIAVLSGLVILIAIKCAMSKRRRPRTSSNAVELAGIEPWEWAVLAAGIVIVAAQSWRFPAAWDDTSYHLPLARTILEHHSLVANEWLRFPYFPAFMHLLFAAGLTVDVTLAQWLASWPVFVALLGLMGAARWLSGHSSWGVFAWVLYASSPALLHVLGFAYVDAALVLFCMAAILAAGKWLNSPGDKAYYWLILAGSLAGISGGIKFQGLVIAAILGCGVFAVGMRRRIFLQTFAAYALPCLSLCAFWYLRSYFMTGDPIHPAGGPLFGYYLWNEQDLALQVQEQASHGVPKHWANFVGALWHVRLSHLYLALAWPLVLLVGLKRRLEWSLVAFVTWGGTLFWFWVSQVDRYLLPIIPLGTLLAMELVRSTASGIGAFNIFPRGWRRYGLATAAMVCAAFPLFSSLNGLMQRPSIADQRDILPEVALLAKAELLAPHYGQRVLNLGYENAFFYYSGQLIGDWFGAAAFPRIARCRPSCQLTSPEQMADIMRRLEVRMLLVQSEKFTFDERQYSSEMVLLARQGPGYLYALR